MEQTLECISAGVKHSVCICPSTSEVFAFLNNKLGQLGIGTETLDSDKAESVRDPCKFVAKLDCLLGLILSSHELSSMDPYTYSSGYR